MEFVLNRDYTLHTVLGRSIGFVKDKPTYVPPALRALVQSIGALPATEEDLKKLRESTEDKTRSPEELSPEDRESVIFAAFDDMIAKNDRESFTGTGLPELGALSAIVGFKIDQGERTSLWNKYNQSKA
jgi:hypothetical protein